MDELNGFAAYWSHLQDIIRTYGHAIQHVFPDVEANRPGFSYTVGLAQEYGHELIVFALPPDVARAILNAAAATLKERRILPVDVVLPSRGPDHPDAINDWAAQPAVLRRCVRPRAAEYVRVAERNAGRPVDVLQLVWPDRAGLFPWDADHDVNLLSKQPALYDTSKGVKPCSE